MLWIYQGNVGEYRNETVGDFKCRNETVNKRVFYEYRDENVDETISDFKCRNETIGIRMFYEYRNENVDETISDFKCRNENWYKNVL